MMARKRNWKRLVTVPTLVGLLPLSTALVVACGSSSTTPDTTETIIQIKSNLNNEVKTIQALTGDFKIQVNDDVLPAADEVEFTSSMATNFGISNFSPNAKFKYFVTHNEMRQDAPLDLVFKVKQGEVVSDNTATLKVAVLGINSYNEALVARLGNELQAITTTALPSTDFANLNYPNGFNWTNDDRIYIFGLVSNLDVPSYDKVQIKIFKSYGTAMRYLITKQDYSADVSVNFASFGQALSQVQIDAEQAKLTPLTYTGSLSATTDAYPHVDNALVTAEVMERFNLTFVRQPGYTYTYSHSRIYTEGQMSIYIRVKSGALYAANIKEFKISVTGFYPYQIEAAKDYIRSLNTTTTTITRLLRATFAEEDFSTARVKLGIPNAVVPNAVDVTVTKGANESLIRFDIKRRNLTDTVSHSFSTFGIDYELVRDNLLNLKTTSKSETDFLALSQARVELTSTNLTDLNTKFGFNMSSIVTSMSDKVKVELQKDATSALMKYYVSRADGTLLYSTQSTVNLFSDKDNRLSLIDKSIVIDGTNLGGRDLSYADFVPYENRTLATALRLSYLSEILRKYYEGRDNPFFGYRTPSVISYINDTLKWNSVTGIYELEFNAYFGATSTAWEKVVIKVTNLPAPR